ncbi:Endogenous retrovirus group PABLB member 1 Env polyprotein [Merluccius polli]|uniref:Endogenous retrovirus group PABLB member 1 Env polyprotein n=1 Tax=Merluccius polli TaxID=89951 RepID=A0AA47MSL5_MERPO|nr:Endogenous retrovirus group PABLB member 1 Env polyprotein [Merluccius polli]
MTGFLRNATAPARHRREATDQWDLSTDSTVYMDAIGIPRGVARQNRMALDMLLAEKGEVCSMFGVQCCTFIPNNTAPDGSVSKALAGLRTLSEQMAEDSGG